MKKTESYAVLACGLGIACYTSMDVVMKGLSLEMGTYNMLLWRGCLILLISGLLFAWRRPGWPNASLLRLHIWRGVVITLMISLFFWGLKYLPVAEAISLTFITPLIALYLASLILKESIGKYAIVASLIGMSGAIIVVAGRLSGEYSDEVGKGIAAILCSAVLAAYNIVLLRKQALLASPIEIAFFQNCTILLILGALSPFMGKLPEVQFIPAISTSAILAVASIMLLSWAYGRAPARKLIPIEYTAFAWAAFWGWLVFNETLTIPTLVGTTIIVCGCIVATWQKPPQIEKIEATVV